MVKYVCAKNTHVPKTDMDKMQKLQKYLAMATRRQYNIR